VFVSSEYGGAKVIELTREGMRTTATELWSSRRVRLHYGGAMRIAGDRGTMMAVDPADARFTSSV
jgi:hypothetical protein